MTTVLITGNTFPVKDKLKALGGRWNPEAKGWDVPADKAEEAKALVANGSNEPAKKFRHTKCVACGVQQTFNARGYPNVKIYRSGECQDCFEERKMGY
jgi:hypothetical protein